MCVISGEKNDNVNVEEKSGIVQVNSPWRVLSMMSRSTSRLIEIEGIWMIMAPCPGVH